MNKTKSTLSKSWQCLRFDFHLLWQIITQPQTTLQYPRLSEYFHTRRIFRHFILPLSIVSSFANLIGTLLTFDEINLESAIVNSIFSFISLILTFYLLYAVIGWLTRNAFNPAVHRWNIEAIVAAIMCVSFTIKIILGLFPSMFFMQFFYIYTFYIVWVASDSIIPINEQQKNRYMIIITFLSIIAPWLVGRLMRLMVPNIAS